MRQGRFQGYRYFCRVYAGGSLLYGQCHQVFSSADSLSQRTVFRQIKATGLLPSEKMFPGFSARGFQADGVGTVPWPDGPEGAGQVVSEVPCQGCICGWRRNERKGLATRKRGSMMRSSPVPATGTAPASGSVLPAVMTDFLSYLLLFA